MLRSSLAACAAFVLSAAPAMAAGLSASQKVEVVTIETTADGDRVEVLTKAERIAPGEQVVYSLNYDNDGEPAEDVVLVMPVPSEVVYIERSASQEVAKTEFSVDGGRSFAPRGSLKVTVNGEDRPALSEDITHVRWTFAEPIPAGVEGRVEFRAQVR